MALTTRVRALLEETGGHPSAEQLLSLDHQELAEIAVEKLHELAGIIEERSRIHFDFGAMQRLRDREPQTGSWQPYRNIIAIRRRNEFDEVDVQIMNALVRLTRVEPNGKTMQILLISVIEGYLKPEGIEQPRIKEMLDKFLRVTLTSKYKSVSGIRLTCES